MPQSLHWTYIGLMKENASGKLAGSFHNALI
jgi:hypothetical protein